MGDTNFRGPLAAAGSLLVDNGTTASIQPFDGPSIFYQGDALPDIRALPFATEGLLPGRVPAFLMGASMWTVDNRPQTVATNVIATGQVATNAVAMSLVTTAVNGVAGIPSITPLVPILPQGTSVVTNAAIAIDFGFATGTTTAANSTIVTIDNTQFTLGQWILIGGAGASNQSPTITQVVSIATANFTGITVSPAPAASLSNCPIGQGNLMGSGLLPLATQFGPGTPVATYHSPTTQAGLARVLNPRETVARNISVSLATGGVATAVNFLVTGWDVWQQKMAELIAVPATTSATTAYGIKAFKYLASVVPQSVAAGNTYAVGIGDTFGLPFRADEWEQTEIGWNGLFVSSSTGFLGAISTTGSPATNTTGDVRGTIQVSTNGKGTAISTSLASNNNARLAIVQDVGVWNTVFGTPNNIAPMFGVTNATA